MVKSYQKILKINYNKYLFILTLSLIVVEKCTIFFCYIKIIKSIVIAPNILAVKIDRLWETSLARFLILLINNNPAKCCHLILSTHVYFLMFHFTTNTVSLVNLHSLSLPRSLSVSPLSYPLAPSSVLI